MLALQKSILLSLKIWNSQSYLGEYFRRMQARHGSPKATTATAHKLARIIYHLVNRGKSFDETVFAHQEKLHRKRLERRLKYQACLRATHRQAKTLGFQLVPCTQEA